MIRKRILLVLAALVLMPVTVPAQAENDHATLLDKRGNVVYNSTGNCVRTRWQNDGDPCAPQAEPPPPPKHVAAIIPPPPPPAPVKRTVISEAARTVYFPFNKAALSNESKSQLDTLASVLKSAKDIQEAHIVGAADRIGSTHYNDKLSEKRAETVRDYLIAQGYTNASVTKTRWVGKSEPITQCSKKLPHKKLVECLHNDRRVQIEIVYKTETVTPVAAPVPHPMPMIVPPTR